MNSESPRLQLLQAVVDAFGFPDGGIEVRFKGGRTTRIILEIAFNADEWQKIEAILFALKENKPLSADDRVV